MGQKGVKSWFTKKLNHRTKLLQNLVQWFTWTVVHDWLKSDSLVLVNYGFEDAEVWFNGSRKLHFGVQTFLFQWLTWTKVQGTDISGLSQPCFRGRTSLMHSSSELRVCTTLENGIEQKWFTMWWYTYRMYSSLLSYVWRIPLPTRPDTKDATVVDSTMVVQRSVLVA